MKTADLIPFILLELNDGDKYGFELSKNIETRLGGQIEIKQPTLYTVLKKLEKSKFISSYWQDSEIGGKRHYYKLTSNGKSQVATLPSYDFLTENLSNEGDVQYDQELPTPQVAETEIKEEISSITPSTTLERLQTQIIDEIRGDLANINEDITDEDIRYGLTFGRSVLVDYSA